MTLTYELNLDILKAYVQTRSKASRSKLSNVTVRTEQTYRQTDATEHITAATFAWVQYGNLFTFCGIYIISAYCAVKKSRLLFRRDLLQTGDVDDCF